MNSEDRLLNYINNHRDFNKNTPITLEDLQLLEGKFSNGYRLLKSVGKDAYIALKDAPNLDTLKSVGRTAVKTIKGKPNILDLKSKYGNALKPIVSARKEIRDVKKEMARRIKKHPGSRSIASDNQKAKLNKLVKNANEKIITNTETINNHNKDLANLVNTHRKQAAISMAKSGIKTTGIAAGVAGGAMGINSIGQKVRQDMKYKKNGSVTKTCSQMYSNPEDIAKCKERLYNKFKVSKLRQGVDTVMDKAKEIVGK